MTDTRISEAIPFVLPLTTHITKKVAWYDLLNGEIADICLGQYGKITHPTGGVLHVQRQYSNLDKACIISKDFILTAPTYKITLKRGGLAKSVNLLLTQLGFSKQLIFLKTGVKPTGITVAFNRNNYNAGISVMSVKASATAPLGTNKILRIQAVGKHYTKRATFTITITA